MFTGLVEMTGTLAGCSGEHLRIRPGRVFADPVFGESVAVNGCCLTLERVLPNGELEFFTMAETLKRTNLGSLKKGDPVNMERALKAGARLGGHIVSGRIDGTGEVLDFHRRPDGDYELKISLSEELAPEVVAKGSIAIDGVSLTVVEVGDGYFTVHLIPVTRDETALVQRSKGAAVNLETDVLAKYVRRQLEYMQKSPKSEITMDTLREAGFL
ncbi:MAG: riboflavin synthase [Lentisphaeria bacterium]|nr:riboflavin synthase [Lentisphaeria bacterium]